MQRSIKYSSSQIQTKDSGRLLSIVLALFLALFCFASTFFLHFIPKSTASIFSYFRLIICLILR